MLKSDERNVYYIDFKVESSPYSSEYSILSRVVDAKSICNYLKEKFDLEKKQGPDNQERDFLSERAKGKEIVYVADIKVDEEKAVFLVKLSDQNVADHTYTNPLQNSVRPIPKDPGEGDDKSAHLVVIFNDTVNGFSRGFLEQVPGLSPSKIKTFFSKVLRSLEKKDHAFFETEHPESSLDSEGNKKMIRNRPVLEITGKLSHSIKEGFNNSILREIEIITHESSEDFDNSEGGISIKKNVVVMSVEPEDGTTNQNFIQKLLPKFRKNYPTADEMRICFTDVEEDKNKSIIVDLDSEVLPDYEEFTKRKKIRGFKSPLLSSYQEVNYEIVEKMIGLAE